MKLFFRTILESFRLAFNELRGNKLRSFLSLLGITIGIFCIIAVQSAVDSLEGSILDLFGGISKEILMIDIFPWDEDPNMNYWKYFKRPSPSENDYVELTERLDLADEVAFLIGMEGQILKNGSRSLEGASTIGTTLNFPEIQDMKLGKGRYFSQQEYESGATKVIIGAEIEKELFPNQESIGKDLKLFGQKFQIIGVLEEEGENPFNVQQMDIVTWMSYNTMKRFVNIKGKSRMTAGTIIYVKPKQDVALSDLRDEMTGVLRAIRRLKPMEEDNFSINSISQLTNIIEGFFGQVKLGGFIIGIFAIIVGLISVANIMFVSVKERTNIIGIKKALGAKQYIILSEFLIESVFLCLLGGLLGILMVYAVATGISAVIPFNISLSMKNIIVGVTSSVVIGVIAGMLPALQASKLDPVEAIRSK
jgi:putative ABC transport system permease protein